MFTAVMIVIGILVVLVIGCALAINYAEAKTKDELRRYHEWSGDK